MSWNAQEIARALATMVFDRRALVMVPNCYWTGDECDLLVVRNDLRLVDVEVKISRADLKADAKKEKWIDVAKYIWTPGSTYVPHKDLPRTPRQWPRKIWKHYYALPHDIWKDSLAECIPATSGVLFMNRRSTGSIGAYVHRQARPCPTAERIGLEEVMDIARVCSARYWDRYARLRDTEQPAPVSP